MTPDDNRIHREVRAAESRMEFALTGLLTLLVAGTLAYVHSLFAPLAPPHVLWSWTGSMGVVTAIMLIVPLLIYIRKPDAEQIERFWSPLGMVVAVLFDVVVAASVWMLLPYASEPLQLLMVIFYSSAISGQVVATAEAIGNITFGVIAIFGSAALFFFRSETLYADSLAIFLLAFGALMIGTALVLKHAIRTAIAQRLRAEAMSADLAAALAATHAERDARTRFIAAASHDLRQPLQAAMLFFRQVLRAPDAERQDRAAQGVQRGLEEAMVMLEGMAEHLRLESGRMEARSEAVPLAGILAALEQELAPAARRAGMALRIGRSRQVVQADPALLNRILRNLLTNALLHSDGTQVRVLVRCRQKSVQIAVVDDGNGIPAAEAEALFLPYAQGSGTRRLGHGSGLGLAIAREMATLMNGTLVHDPRWTSGCAFVLTLPEGILPEAAAPGHEAADPDRTLDGQIVLLVEDRPDTREAVAGALRLHGAEVWTFASSAEVADALAQGLRPSAVITDWHLGREDSGAQVIALVHAICPHARALVMSGDATGETARQVAEAGCPLLVKPVPEPVLLAALTAT